jgi:hypothetical protein
MMGKNPPAVISIIDTQHQRTRDTMLTIKHVLPTLFDSGSGRDMKMAAMTTPNGNGLRNAKEYRRILTQPLYCDGGG